MAYPERFSNLPVHAWPRLRSLLDAHAPGGDAIHMTIGEPRHAFPPWVAQVISDHSADFAKYPANDGTPELRQSIAAWTKKRYGVSVDPETQIMALNGTREGLFNACLALCSDGTSSERPVVLTPNPFYAVYAVAASAAGAEPHYVPATAETGFLPDYASLSPELLDRTAVAYLCSPSNPEGAVAGEDYWTDLFHLAEKHDFIIFADECYSEIYRDQAPVGALQIADAIGADPERVVIFHSLSKRSNLPGLRSGFVASGPENIRRIKDLRAYAGAPLPLPLQKAAETVWADEVHVEENRALYREKYDIADRILGNVPGYRSPEAGFFLWLPVEDGATAALKLWRETGVRVLPGAYIARDMDDGTNPGTGYIRVALVAEKEEMTRGLTQLRDCLYE